MASCKFDIADGVTLSTRSTFDGALVDAALFTLYIRTPPGQDGEAAETLTIEGTDLALSDDGTRWEYVYVTERVGTHYYRFECSNPAAADEDSFLVRASVFY